MEFPDNRIGEIKRDWTRLELSPNHQSDSTMIHGKRLKTGESSWDGMPISESLNDTPGKGFHEDVEMEDTQEKIIGGGTNDAANFHHKIFLEFQAWIKIIFGLNLPEDQKSRVQEEIIFFEEATAHLFESWQWYDFWEKNPHIFSENEYASDGERFKSRIEDEAEKWLQSVLKIEKIEKFLVKKDNEAVRVRTIIQKGYELMFKFMIDLEDIGVISKKNISTFLNQTEGQIISAYATCSDLDPMTGTPSWQFEIRKKLQMNWSIYGLPELLKLINENTWKKIEVKYLGYRLWLLLQENLLDRNNLLCILNHFLTEADKNKKEVSTDHIFSLLKHLSFSFINSVQGNTKEVLEKYMKQEGISTFSMIKKDISPANLDTKLVEIALKKENESVFDLLVSIHKKLEDMVA